jgi:hypothetical protein
LQPVDFGNIILEYGKIKHEISNIILELTHQNSNPVGWSTMISIACFYRANIKRKGLGGCHGIIQTFLLLLEEQCSFPFLQCQEKREND